ncbi:hypothetical protein MMC21_003736 [Puttea exsequens]|nr:hypothetical protein [Puttea exsequens]
MKSYSGIITALEAGDLSCLLSQQVFAGPTFRLNTNVLKNIHEILPEDTYFNVQDPLFTSSCNLTLQLPNEAIISALSTFEDRSTIDKGAPLLVEAIKELLGQEHADEHGLQTGSFLGNLLDWAEGAGYALVASTGFGVYLIAAADYRAANSGGVGTNPDQDFFLTLSHGGLAHTAPVTIYYNAAQNPFIDIPGITFNRDVYLNTPLVREYGTQNWVEFATLVQLLIQEFTHVEQYAATNYNLVSYVHSYIYQWCRAGFRYSAIDFEVEAKSREPEVNSLLIFGAPGNAYFWLWKFKDLSPTLGNPVARAPLHPSIGEAGSELPFQSGTLQIRDLRDNPPSYRIFTPGEIAQRAAAQCNPDATPPPVCPGDKKTKRRSLLSLLRRTPTPTPMQKDGSVGPPCKPGNKAASAKKCRDAKAVWTKLEASRAWVADITIPKPPVVPPPPPPKPGVRPNARSFRWCR